MVAKPKTPGKTGKLKKPPKPLRVMADPFVVEPPKGTSTRTRIFGSDESFTALTEVGMLLGSKYRSCLSSRLQLGDEDTVSSWWAQEKKTLTASTTSRWGGSLTFRVMEQYDLSMRNLEASIETFNAIIQAISIRLNVPAGETVNGVKGYTDPAEVFLKKRRLLVVKDRLVEAERELAAGHPTIVVGGAELLRHRSNLEAAELTETEWRAQWDAARLFLQAPGESVKYGNQTISVIPVETSSPGRARLRVRVPNELTLKYGQYLWFEVSTDTHRSTEWLTRVEAGKPVQYRIDFDTVKRRWYLDASWTFGEKKLKKDGTTAKSVKGVKGKKTAKTVSVPSVEQLGSLKRVGVDLNAGHLAVMDVDRYGNPVGQPADILLELEGLPASTRDAYLRHAVTLLVKHALSVGAGVIVIENLGFEDARATGRETMGRGTRGKKFRKTVAGMPTAKFRERLVSMASRAGLWVIAVDPAYTSRWGREHWLTPLQSVRKTSTMSAHHAAALMVARRSMGYKLKRKTGPQGRRSITLDQLAEVEDPSMRAVPGERTRPPESLEADGKREGRLRGSQNRSGSR